VEGIGVIIRRLLPSVALPIIQVHAQENKATCMQLLRLLETTRILVLYSFTTARRGGESSFSTRIIGPAIATSIVHCQMSGTEQMVSAAAPPLHYHATKGLATTWIDCSTCCKQRAHPSLDRPGVPMIRALSETIPGPFRSL
jgi:hypothetical protein